jgi:coxsackievirus/adenovirus receptor
MPRLERSPGQQPGASLLIRYFMIPCNICLILLATSTLGFAVLLFLNNCRWSQGGAQVALLLLAKPPISLPRVAGQVGSQQAQGP